MFRTVSKQLLGDYTINVEMLAHLSAKNGHRMPMSRNFIRSQTKNREDTVYANGDNWPKWTIALTLDYRDNWPTLIICLTIGIQRQLAYAENRNFSIEKNHIKGSYFAL